MEDEIQAEQEAKWRDERIQQELDDLERYDDDGV